MADEGVPKKDEQPTVEDKEAEEDDNELEEAAGPADANAPKLSVRHCL